jgi:hypothetical protein
MQRTMSPNNSVPPLPSDIRRLERIGIALYEAAIVPASAADQNRNLSAKSGIARVSGPGARYLTVSVPNIPAARWPGTEQ